MKSLIGRFIAAFGLLVIVSAPSWAVVQVGEDFTLNFKAVDGSTISTEALKGKILVVDFWATWCGPCMGMVPHMVETNQKYGPMGLQMIGISLDQDRNALIATTKEKGMTWPEYFDGAVWNNKYWKQYGSNGIPFTVLVSPQGKVLYAGHPAAGLDGAIEKGFKETPPVLVDPKIVSQANATLDDVKQKIASGDTKAAIKLLGKVPAQAKLDGGFAARAADVQKELEEAANSMLAQAQSQIDQEKYTEAVARLKELSNALSGLPAGTKATAMLNSLMSKPQARAAIAAAERNAKAVEALQVAQKLQAQKKDELAYARFSDVVRIYPGTDAATEAQSQVSQYEKDTAFIKRVKEKDAATKATAALHMGNSYKAAGNAELARRKYQSVIDEFPGTSYADEAQKALAMLAQ